MNSETRSSTLVWDLPVRVFHWLLVLCFAGAWLTAESEHWRLVHVTLGYTMAALVAFRIVWGLLGTRYARFASFVRGPRAALAYLRSLPGPKPEHHTGHNPAGALAIVGLLGLIAVTTATGWASYSELAGDWLEEVHEVAANGLLALVIIHLIGVAVGSWVHRENLVRSMLTGRKPVPPAEGIRRGWATVAAVMLAAVLGFWWVQWQSAPADTGAQISRANHDRHESHGDSD
ncbi:cytochrome b/b6 domain-containing protein [Rhizobacter sp. AJA081-3]|uniref:cytochrome b/b6 domain-containing protein n=1 Tax=Rhizobacter sp. AJA081-3 TaxID=2753607 RepID=UPI001ADFEF18|nr:cytochrome b/b6 domain-containing protein [Rhizobacter sp. AJA081-3]QTN23180.1 cytochrome b/b6 domain-containing protein [Rhizobacter sp. AJA081-3]